MTRSQASRAQRRPTRALTRLGPTDRAIGGGALLAAGTLHAVVVAPHLVDDALTGAFFLVVQIVQLGTGLAVLASPGRLAHGSLRAGAALSAGVLLVYVVSRTVGLPIGPDEPRTIGVVDAVAALLELASIWAAVAAERALRSRSIRAESPRAAAWLAGAVMVALTAYAVAIDRGHPDDGVDAAPTTAEGSPPLGEPAGSVRGVAEAAVIATSATFGATEALRPATVELPAGVETVIRFTNADEDAQHNLSLYEPGTRGSPRFVGRIVAPGEAVDLPFTSPAPGRYALRCDLHPWMQATLLTVPPG